MRFRLPRPVKAAAGVAALGVALSGCLLADGTTQTIALAGSDTTQDVMAAVASYYNSNSYNSDPDTLVNILSQQTTPLNVAADAACGALTYATPAVPPQVLAPNGSSAGRDALKNSVNNGDGCIDIARSSAGPRAIGSDLASFEYYAYAIDGVSWASASANAPTNLTQAQIQSIYNCTVTDWSAVGGAAGAIQRYYPQSGSGTRSFFQTEVLGFDPTLISGPNCPAVKLTQENSGTTIAANGDQATAIVPYSAANWVAHARGTVTDQRAGQTIRSINGTAFVTFPSGVATPGPALVESNVKLVNPTPAVPGVRFVFNVVDNTSISYEPALRFVGFENQTAGAPDYPSASPLCDNKLRTTLENYGFKPLDRTISSRNLRGSTCRLYTP